MRISAVAAAFVMAGLVAPAGAVCDVTLSRQLSSSDCRGNFGCFEGNRSMWVSGGCRGVFSCDGAANVVCDPCDPGPCPKGHSGAVCPCVSAPPPPPAPKYLLLDDRNVVVTANGSRLVLGEVVKRPGGPVIREERDWEMRFDNMQPNVWFDPQMGVWRAWYSTFTDCGGKPPTTVPYCSNHSQQCGTTTQPSSAKRGTALLYAESRDGFTWTKPSLGIAEWKGSTDNNIVAIGGMTTGVYLDEDTADPRQRYKLATGSNGAGGVAVSADGLRWNSTKNLAPETHARWDTPKNVVWDPVQKQWIMYVRSTPTVAQDEGGSIRVQSMTHSLTDDFMGDWAPATPTGLNSSSHYQPDGLVVWPYEGIFIGIGNVFNPFQEAGPQAAVGQVNTVLGWSADGRRWKWVLPDQSLVPLGSAGDFDACGVFGAKQDPLRTARGNDTMRLYYTGCNGPFFGPRGCALGVATLQRDGWAGYRGGTVTTAPVRVSSPELRVSVAGGASGVRVGVVGSKTLTADACDPVVGKQTDAVVTWNGITGLGSLVNGAVAFEFVIPDDATVFAFAV